MTTLSLKVRPRWWDRDNALAILTSLHDLVMFRELGYSIAPPRYNRYGDRKEAGFNIVFKSKANKKEFMKLGLTQLLLSKLEKNYRDRFVIETDYHKTAVQDSSVKASSA